MDHHQGLAVCTMAQKAQFSCDFLTVQLRFFDSSIVIFGSSIVVFSQFSCDF